MKVDFSKSGGRFPIAHIEENVRGKACMLCPELSGLFDGDKSFSVSIAKGAGEVFFKMIGGKWCESVHSVDKCFGFIKGKYREI